MNKKGFTLIELLIGLTISATIFIMVTNLVVSLLFSTTKEKRLEELAQARNDVETEVGTVARWANSISYMNGVFSLDQTKYTIKDGRFMKNGIPLTSNNIIVENLRITKQTLNAPVTNSGSGQGLTGVYYSGTNFNTQITTHTDFGIDFNWGPASPAQNVPADQFSVRWTGQIEIPTTGQYTFYTQSDDGARLWIDNQLVVDDWGPHSSKEGKGTITLDGGKLYDIRLEYYDDFINARIALSWSGPGISKAVIPASNLYETSAQSSLNIQMDLVHKESSNIKDAINLFISPREGIVSSIDNATPTPGSTSTPGGSSVPTASGSPTSLPTGTPNPTGSASPTQIPTNKPTTTPTPKPKP